MFYRYQRCKRYNNKHCIVSSTKSTNQLLNLLFRRIDDVFLHQLYYCIDQYSDIRFQYNTSMSLRFSSSDYVESLIHCLVAFVRYLFSIKNSSMFTNIIMTRKLTSFSRLHRRLLYCYCESKCVIQLECAAYYYTKINV